MELSTEMMLQISFLLVYNVLSVEFLTWFCLVLSAGDIPRSCIKKQEDVFMSVIKATIEITYHLFTQIHWELARIIHLSVYYL